MTNPASPSPTSILRVGALSRLGTVDIRESDDTISTMILAEIFETPYSPPMGNESPTPLLFTGMLQHEPDGTPARPVYSAQIRPAVTFSDGTPLTAELFRASLAKVDDVRAHCEVEARGDRLVFRLKSPNPRFELFLTQTFCGAVLEKGGQLLGTGPMMFPEGATKSQLLAASPLRLVRNPRYRDAVTIDEITFSAFPASSGGGTEVLLDATRRGEIDFTFSLTSVDAAGLQGYPFIPSISTGNATGILFLNTEKPSLRDSEVRRSIALSVDRREISRRTYEKNPLAFVAGGLLPPLMARDHDSLGHDPKAAKELAAKLGSALPKKLQLLVTWSPRPYLPNPKAAAETIIANLAEIGITVEPVQPRDRNDFFDRVKRGSFEMALAGWVADTADPADYFEALLSSAQIPDVTKVTATSFNLPRWRNAAMDAALVKFRGEPTDANRREVIRLLGEGAPLVPLIHGQAVAVYSSRISGFRPSPLGRASLARLRFMK